MVEPDMDAIPDEVVFTGDFGRHHPGVMVDRGEVATAAQKQGR